MYKVSYIRYIYYTYIYKILHYLQDFSPVPREAATNPIRACYYYFKSCYHYLKRLLLIP